AIEAVLIAGRIDAAHSDDFVSAAMNAGYAKVGDDFAAHSFYLPGDRFPHLSRSVFRVEELLYQRRFGFLLGDVLLLSALQLFLDNVLQCLLDRKPLDSLLAPFGADLIAGHSPDFLGVGLEEGVV